ncbi:hypothetical protein BISA_1687 [Bifidobacterium saguini DSM 23967]|uniref:Uncharacterized protein n=1 Tax=Bifidobacterium saguini DSM 23967 TaxID=1437607 RepID=A0A087DEB3_9BIFI|nr:hypothetical protein BISA_1687 [Bifidobacterium saguini DSM 23967]
MSNSQGGNHADSNCSQDMRIRLRSILSRKNSRKNLNRSRSTMRHLRRCRCPRCRWLQLLNIHSNNRSIRSMRLCRLSHSRNTSKRRSRHRMPRPLS